MQGGLVGVGGGHALLLDGYSGRVAVGGGSCSPWNSGAASLPRGLCKQPAAKD